MRHFLVIPALLGWVCVSPVAGRAEALPFQHKVEVFREKDTDEVVFALRLEQPFLADEFEKSNYLRLQARDKSSYLIYPKETRFQQKHAEFYGRLRGQGKAKLRLAYETVAESANGSPKVEVRYGDLAIVIPQKPGGPPNIFREWANHQNAHFLDLLNYYPEETFFQYVLLQSRHRYGIAPPRLNKGLPNPALLESSLYGNFTGSQAIQEALQHRALQEGAGVGDLEVHIKDLSPPPLASLPYDKLLEEKRAKKILPRIHDLARLVPMDQYFLHFHSVQSAGEVLDLVNRWGDSLLRFMTVRALDNRLQEKLEEQLCLRRDPLTRLFRDGVVTEMAVTGCDPFVLEGTDVTFVFRLKRPEVFEQASAKWLDETKKKYPHLAEREFNYRGHKVAARYTDDRLISSFVVRHENYAIYSNSHRVIRRMVDTFTGNARPLSDASDYRYVTTLLPPKDGGNTGYFYASEAFLRRLVGPEAKIAEKRRLQCFNNLVMLNNASLFYRLEHGTSPASLADLVEGRFVDSAKVVCPHGGAYALDVKHDTCTCSLHNRLKYLTPNAELPVLKVSRAEKDEFERYKARYQEFWQTVFDPIAVRITLGPRVRLEVCVLPFANGGLYGQLRDWVQDKPQLIQTQRIAKSAVASFVAVPGRKAVSDLLRGFPGLAQVLKADPTLTDLSWLGDCVGLHYCDGDTILEIDPTHLRPLDVPLGGKVPVSLQAMAGALLTATELPVYVSIDVEDRDKGVRFLEQLARSVPLHKGDFFGLPVAADSYRLPDYQKQAIYVVVLRVHAVKLRLYLALVGNQLVAATKSHVVRQVIDARTALVSQELPRAHLLLRLNRRAINQLQDNLNLSWSEKSRLACHRNTISIYNLVKLYDVPVDGVARLSEAKYGVRYFCPEHGIYEYDAARDRVLCSVHGNRQESRQHPRPDRKASFVRFMESMDELVASLRFDNEALIATVDIVRRQSDTK